MYYPQVDTSRTYRDVTDTFDGYVHKLKIGDGQMYDMVNLTGDHYPLLSPRRKRGTVRTDTEMQGIIAKDAMAEVRDGKLYYNLLEVTGLTLTEPVIYRTDTEPTAVTGDYWYKDGVTKQKRSSGWVRVSYPSKQLVSMGAYLCIFPDKKWYNTADGTFGNMGATFESVGAVEYSITRLIGDDDALAAAIVSQTPPDNPTNGQYWIDTSGNFDVLNQYSAQSKEWVQIPTVYTRITSAGIGASFSQYDGVTISGATASDESIEKVKAEVDALNGSKIIYDVATDSIVVIGLISRSADQKDGVSLGVTRDIPDFDYVCESGNRLWGCFYGAKNGETINELYCSALGDFKNWNRFMGLSTDSWTASCGTDGQWTGCINYLGNPTFFKEDHIHQISISSSGAHQVTDWAARGVQKGSWRSLAIVGETLYYKSRQGVCAYQGGLPVTVDDALGGVQYSEACAGAFGDTLYMSMNSADGWSLFSVDTLSGRWYREDDLHVIGFAAADDDIFCITPNGEYALRGTQGTVESTVNWSATSGVLYYQYPDHKYVSRYDLRMRMEPGSHVTVYVQYDSSGVWEEQGKINFSGLNSVSLPIRPRRCDHLMIKLSGAGDVRLFSLARVLEIGSDV